MTLSHEVWELVRAGFPGIWIETHEASEAILELSMLGREHDLLVLHWNLESGLRHMSGDGASDESNDPRSVTRPVYK